MNRETVSAYYALTKPGVLYGNVFTAVAGFLLAAALADSYDWLLFTAMLAGMTLVVASACVLNNYLDQDIDAVMARTKRRPSVTGKVAPRNILMFSVALGIVGIAILSLWTNWLVVMIGIVGFVTYVWLYGALSKRRSIHGTLVGSISGAMPIAGGYAAVSGVIDPALVIVFLVVFFWQFPEFFSIAIYRSKEYAAAKIPVMPVVVGVPSTIRQIFIATILYVAATISLSTFGYTGYVYAIVMAAHGAYWIWLGWQGLYAKDSDAWARRMFKQAMISLVLFSVMIAIGPLLP